MTDGAQRDPGAPPAAPTELRERSNARLTDPVAFAERGYGSTCSVCGSLVVGADGQAIHRRHHRVLASMERELR